MASLLFKDRASKATDLVWLEGDYSELEENLLFSVSGMTLANLEDPKATTSGKNPLADILGFSSPIEDLDKGIKISYEEDSAREARLKRTSKLRKEDDLDKLSTATKHFLHHFSSGALEKFMTECAEIMSKTPITLGMTPQMIHVFRVFNFIALTMLRRMSKTIPQMTTTFIKTQYKANIATLIPGRVSPLYAPPTKSCIERLNSISKTDPCFSTMIAKIVVIWSFHLETDQNVGAILGATILTHTAWNGMGILHTIFELCNHYTIRWKSIMRETLVSNTMESWKLIFDFCCRHQIKGKETRSIPWARLIDDAYFMGMSISKHITLASLLIESIKLSQGDDGILESKWAMDHATTIEYYREASLFLQTRLAGTQGPVSAAHSQAIGLAERINKSKPQPTSHNQPKPSQGDPKRHGSDDRWPMDLDDYK